MLTASQVAQILGLSARFVYDLAARGELASHRFGGAVRFTVEDVETYRQSCRSAGTPATSAGGMSSTVLLRDTGTDLAAYFRAAGVKPKLTPTTGKSPRASRRLRVVSSAETP